MFVSFHARQRYRLRVDATCPDVVLAIKWMWVDGHEATDADCAAYGTKRHEGADYRVAQAPNGLYFLLVRKGEAIVTLIDQTLSNRAFDLYERRYNEE